MLEYLVEQDAELVYRYTTFRVNPAEPKVLHWLYKVPYDNASA
jgi:hypothetical protein